MEKPPAKPGVGSDDISPAPTAPREMPKFGSTATFGAAPLQFSGATFGKPAGSGGFFNIVPSFGGAASSTPFPSFLKLSCESTERPKSPPKTTETPLPPPKAPAALDFFSSTTTSITFNMPKLQWGITAPQQAQPAAPAALFGVKPEKPSAAAEKEEDEDGEEGGDAEQPPSPPQSYATSAITKPTEPILTGEENEVHVYQVNKVKLYRLDKDEQRTFWKEKGVGQLRINCARDNPQDCRVLMRMEGALKLILNAKIFPTMPARLVGESSVAISALSDEGDGKLELQNFLVKVQGRTEAELLLGAIEVQKQKAAEVSSPKGQGSSRTKRGGEAQQEADARPQPAAKDAPKKLRRKDEQESKEDAEEDQVQVQQDNQVHEQHSSEREQSNSDESARKGEKETEKDPSPTSRE